MAGRTLLEAAVSKAAELNIPVTVIRDDIVARCGPLGGVITGMAQCPAARILFLPCDMPFVGRELLIAVTAAAEQNAHGACASDGDLAGFPIVINRAAEGVVKEQHQSQVLSLQKLVRRLELSRVPSGEPERELFNINTEEDYRQAQKLSDRR